MSKEEFKKKMLTFKPRTAHDHATRLNAESHEGVMRKLRGGKKFADTAGDLDWRDRGAVTDVKDQGQCGSCWAFAATAVLESHIAIETGTLFNLAPQEFVSCMPNPEKCGGTGGCSGATVDLAFDYAMKNGGIVQEYQMGYTR